MVFRFFMALCMAYAVFAQPLPTSAVGTLAPTHEPDAPSGGSVNTCTLAALQTAMSGGGTVTFNCFGTIVFTSTWVVTANTFLNGNGFNVTLSGGNVTDLFTVNAGAKLTLNRLTLQNGSNNTSGGCVRAFGDLDVISSIIRFCKAESLFVNPNGGAIYANNALVQITNTTIYSNSAEGVGGGIYAIGNSDLRINQSTIRQNTSFRGGGVYQDSGTAIFSSSNVVSNTATAEGGGLYAAGIQFSFYQGELSYNYVSSDTIGIGGGGYFTSSAPFFVNAAIMENKSEGDSGGLYSGGQSGALSLYSNVISGNIAGGSPGGVHSEGNIITLQNNLFQGNRGYPYGGAFRNTSYADTIGNVFIQNHGYYGGGIYNDAGKPLIIHDTTFISNTAAYGGAIRNDGIIDDGIGITFTGNTVPYRGGAFYSGNSSARTHFDRVTATRNSADQQEGGAFYIDSTGNALTLTHALIANNLTGLHGGGIYSRNARVHIENSQINDNTHKNITNTSSGMAIYATGGPASTYLSEVDVYRNRAAYLAKGGALHLEGDAVVLHTKISDNSINGAGSGSGIYFLNANAEVHFSELNNNTGAYGGGGIYAENSTLLVDQSEMQANEASAYGAGIQAFQTTLNLFDVVVRNHASGLSEGGGIKCYSCTGIWQYLTAKSNTATRGGGADLYQSQVRILSSLFETNSATDGAGLHAHYSTISITNTTFSGNVASGDGGGVYGKRSLPPATAITATNVTFKNNGAASGGNLFLESDSGSFKAEGHIRNTVLADPASGGNCGGKPISTAFYSLSTDFTCQLNLLSATNKTDGTSANLGILWFNGGYAKSHMPLAGSVLIDGVVGPIGPSTDQRNAGRPVGLGFDIGAVEYGSSAVFFVDAFRNFVPNTARSFSAGW